MRLSSVRAIKAVLGCDVKVATELRTAMEGYRNKALSLNKTLRECNRILNGYSVEYIPSRQDTEIAVYGLEYVNIGEAYRPTVYFDYRALRFHVGAVGDVVECHDYRFGK